MFEIMLNKLTVDEIRIKLETGDRDFKNSYFKGIDFRKIWVDYQGADFSNSYFYECDLRCLDLKNNNFEKCKIDDTCFLGADLENAKFNGSSCCDSNFNGAKLDYAKFSNARMSKCKFVGASLNRASFDDAVVFHRTDFTVAKLNDAILDGARFLDVYLYDAKFERASVVETTFDNVRFNKNTSFLYVDFQKAKWEHCRFFKRFIEDQQYIQDVIKYFKGNKKMSFVLWLWGVTSNYGQSIKRWALCSFSISFVFGLIFSSGYFLDIRDYETWLSPFYFSIVTFTTLGFGDVIPKNEIGQFLVILEVLVGYLMLGGLISILANIFARRA